MYSGLDPAPPLFLRSCAGHSVITGQPRAGASPHGCVRDSLPLPLPCGPWLCPPSGKRDPEAWVRTLGGRHSPRGRGQGLARSGSAAAAHTSSLCSTPGRCAGRCSSRRPGPPGRGWLPDKRMAAGRSLDAQQDVWNTWSQGWQGWPGRPGDPTTGG